MAGPEEAKGVARRRAEHVERDSSEVVDGLHDTLSEEDRIAALPTTYGQLPTADQLREYEQVLPGLASDIVANWRNDAQRLRDDRRKYLNLDEKSMDGHYKAEARGQVFGLIVSTQVTAVAALSIVLDYPIVGVAGTVAGIAGAVWALRRRSDGPMRADELAHQADEAPPPE